MDLEDPDFVPNIEMLVDRELQKNVYHRKIMKQCLPNEIPDQNDTWVDYLRIRDVAKYTDLSVFGEDFG